MTKWFQSLVTCPLIWSYLARLSMKKSLLHLLLASVVVVNLVVASNVNRHDNEEHHEQHDAEHHEQHDTEHHEQHQTEHEHEGEEHDVEAFLEAAERLGFDADLVFDVASELRDDILRPDFNSNNDHMVSSNHGNHGNHGHHDSAAQRTGEVVGQLASSGARIALKALTIQSKMVAPLVKLGTKVKAPVVGLKAKLAKPLVFAGAVLAKPFLKKKVKVAAPALALASIKAEEKAHIFNPLAAGIAEAIKPVTDELKPFEASLKPLSKAVAFGLTGVQQVADKALAQSQSLRDDVEDIREEVRNIMSSIGLSESESHHNRDPRSNQFSFVNTVVVENENEASVEIEDDQSNSEANDEELNDADDDERMVEPPMITATARFDSECEVSNPSLFTSECTRIEEYRTRVCTAECGLDVALNQFDLLCQQAAPGFQCQKSCFTNAQGCIVCSFKFVRVFIGKPECQALNQCLLKRQFCDGPVRL